MLQVSDSAASVADLAMAIDVVLPSAYSRASAREVILISELNNWAWAYPCRCYTSDVAVARVRLRADVSG
jgi:hypothetical protein